MREVCAEYFGRGLPYHGLASRGFWSAEWWHANPMIPGWAGGSGELYGLGGLGRTVGGVGGIGGHGEMAGAGATYHASGAAHAVPHATPPPRASRG